MLFNAKIVTNALYPSYSVHTRIRITLHTRVFVLVNRYILGYVSEYVISVTIYYNRLRNTYPGIGCAIFSKFLRHNHLLIDLSELSTRISSFFEFGQRLPLPLANFWLNCVCYNNVRNI